MESLESRMERLTPEQRREVEDFVDFILLKNNIRQVPVSPPNQAILSAPPSLLRIHLPPRNSPRSGCRTWLSGMSPRLL